MADEPSTEKRKRDGLSAGAHGDAKDGLQEGGPDDGGEEEGLEGGDELVGRLAPLVAAVEDADVVPPGARAVGVVVERGAVLAGSDGPDLLSG